MNFVSGMMDIVLERRRYLIKAVSCGDECTGRE